MAKSKKKKAEKRIVKSVELPLTSDRFTVAIVGGGASGIAAACAVAACSAARVILLEKGRRIGASILRSGNGRCNFSHVNISAAAFNQPGFVTQAFEALDAAYCDSLLDDRMAPALPGESACANAVLRWFASLGLVWQEAPNSDGLLYPYSNKATSVLEVLQAELDRCGVEAYCGVAVERVSRCDDRFALSLNNNFEEADLAELTADVVIYAAGGQPVNIGAEPLETVPLRPMLGPLKTSTQFLQDLDGIRAQVRLVCPARGFAEDGEVLFRDYGISGIVAFNASRFVEPGDSVLLDFIPQLSVKDFEVFLGERTERLRAELGHEPIAQDVLRGFLLPELATMIAAFSDERSISLAAAMKSFELVVEGIGDEKQCQIHRGGVSVDQINAETMQVKHQPGLFITGEALDVDGPCGGYNLHWAWTSGLLAGLSAASSFAQDLQKARVYEAESDRS